MPNRGSIEGIQILRGIAALAVLAHHIFEESQNLFPPHTIPDALILAGAAGVDLFFVISGFIMLYTSARTFGTPGAAGDFLARRLIRIVPLYWLCSLAVIALGLTGAFYKSKLIAASNTLASLLFLPTDDLILGVGWTLQYEMYFYLLFAVCLAFLKIRRTIVVLPIALTAAIGLGHLLPAGPLRTFLVNPIALEFALGIWLAYALLNGRLPRISPLLTAALGVLGIALASLFAPHIDANGLSTTSGLSHEARFWAWGVPALLIVHASLSIGKIRGRAGRVLLLIGDASYSIYLTHAIVMTSYARALKSDAVTHTLPPVVLMLLAGAVAMAVGLATYKLVEQPANEWIKARRKRSRGVVAVGDQRAA